MILFIKNKYVIFFRCIVAVTVCLSVQHLFYLTNNSLSEMLFIRPKNNSKLLQLSFLPKIPSAASLQKLTKLQHHPKAPISELSKIDNNKILIPPHSEICRNENKEKGKKCSIILVLNRFFGFVQRASIRSTYANSSSFKENVKFKWKVLFLTGKPTNDQERESILEESRLFGDILVTNIPEEYFSPTVLKLLIGFEFIAKNCPDLDYLVKTDDDVYLHLPNLEKAIEGTWLSTKPPNKLFLIQ